MTVYFINSMSKIEYDLKQQLSVAIQMLLSNKNAANDIFDFDTIQFYIYIVL